MDGFLIIDKPGGLTSHDVVARVKRLLSVKKVGHAGTLDPFATGILPLAINGATKKISEIAEGTKEYRAVLELGAETETGDGEGKIVRQEPVPPLTALQVESVLSRFRGAIQQNTPSYSAVRYKGKPLYAWSREGKTTPIIPRQVTIEMLTLEATEERRLTFFICCSQGTYIRSLLPDIAKALGTCGFVSSLRRLRVGPFALDQATTLMKLEEAVLKVKEKSDLDFTTLPGSVSLRHHD
ncbi:MAG: tRNA pseudouridine(55) synthase TruB [Deltaproteobacteria bacterium]|nr:tRNA pseudouridine(55) synthase TruB [Deltaproteobacteria bacterium]